jgi:hypothetical protein
VLCAWARTATLRAVQGSSRGGRHGSASTPAPFLSLGESACAARVPGASLFVVITCPACGVSTRCTVSWIRVTGGAFCQGCTELIMLDGARFASACEAIDEAVRELDDVIGELRKLLAASMRGAA